MDKQRNRTRGTDPAKANTKEDLVVYVLHMWSYSYACVHSAGMVMKNLISTYFALNADSRKIVLYCQNCSLLLHKTFVMLTSYYVGQIVDLQQLPTVFKKEIFEKNHSLYLWTSCKPCCCCTLWNRSGMLQMILCGSKIDCFSLQSTLSLHPGHLFRLHQSTQWVPPPPSAAYQHDDT